MTRWFLRSGKRISAAAVKRAQQRYAEAKRTGHLGPLPCSVRPNVADAIEKMSLKQFASWSGMFVWRD
jgi:hypothetical protein